MRYVKLGALVVLAAVAAALIVGVSRSAGHPGKGGAVTIQSWLHATPSVTGLSGTVTACMKLGGAFVDQGGEPTWNDETYANPSSPADKCDDWTPVGGFNFVPPVGASEDSTLYAVHTITGAKGQIFITFAGSYNLVSTFQGSGTWVITGGTGAYNGVRGEGTWTADASTFPYIRHTESGTIERG